MARESEHWRPRKGTEPSTNTGELPSPTTTTKGNKMRVASGDVSLPTRERLLQLQAAWYLKNEERISMEHLVQRAIEAGVEQLEQQVA